MKIITKLFGRIYVINIFTVLIKLKHYFFNPVQPPPIINNYYNVQPPYYSNPSYYSGLESNSSQNICHIFKKSNEIGLSMETSTADLFQFSSVIARFSLL